MNLKSIFKKYSKGSKKGFNLVELVATIAVIAITSGATISVFLMVHQVTRDAGEITVNQFNVTQMERLIRNEIQVGSNIDFDKQTTWATGGSHESDIEKDDEYICYDEVRKEVVFKRADNTGAFRTVFTVDNVSEVSISVAPLNDVADDKNGQPYKLFYKITTSHYDYSGGFVLGNTNIGSDDSMMYAGTNNKTLNWKKGAADNEYVFYYHRESTNVESSSATSSTP